MRPIEIGKLCYIIGFMPSWVLTSLILGMFDKPILWIIGFTFSDVSAFLALLFAIDTGIVMAIFGILIRYTDWVK